MCAVPSLLRHRESLVEMAAATHVNPMQKALGSMNLQPHHVISDITGQTGLAILDAIVPDELCIEALAGCRTRFVADKGILFGGFPETHIDKLSAVEAYLRYGGAILVDSIDRGRASIPIQS